MERYGWTLITGATRGLGEEMAELAIERGRKVLLTAQSETELHALAERLRAKGGIVDTIPADFTDPDSVQNLWNEAITDRQISFLINSASVDAIGELSDGNWTAEITAIDYNINALTLLCKLASKHMKTHRTGRILNVASVAAYIPGPGRAVFHATKAYVLSLSNSLHEELQPFGITVTAFCPDTRQSDIFSVADAAQSAKRSGLPSLRQVAERGYFAAMRGRPLAVQGFGNIAMVALSGVLPGNLLTKLAGITR